LDDNLLRGRARLGGMERVTLYGSTAAGSSASHATENASAPNVSRGESISRVSS